MSELVRTILQGLWPHASHPTRVLSELNDFDEIVRVVVPDMDLSFDRLPDETAEAMDRRVCNSILEARGLALLPSKPGMAEQLRANAPPPPERLRAEPQHHGSKLADPSVPGVWRKKPQHYKPRTFKVVADV